MDEQEWKVVDSKGQALCTAPCSQWIRPKSGIEVVTTHARVDDRDWLSLPDEQLRKYDVGSELVAEFSDDLGHPTLGKVLFWTGTGFLVGSAAALGTSIAVSNESETFGYDPKEQAKNWRLASAGLAGAGLLLGGAGLYFILNSRGEFVRVSPVAQ